MATVVLNAYSKAYPAITNRIRASVYLQSDPLALIATIIDSTSGHPARTWSFPGLPRNNYAFSLDEIDGSGNVVNNLALFVVNPGEMDGQTVRNDEQIKVGTTTGLVAGTSGFTFDGSSGKEDYRGWVITISEIGGRSPMILNQDYSWDSVSGTFTLLTFGDTLQNNQVYNIHFNPQPNLTGNSFPALNDFQCTLITTNTSLTPDSFGGKLICEPAGNYMEVTFPDITTVVAGRRLFVEVSAVALGSGVKCVKFVQFGTDTINFLRGNIFALSGESFSIYKFIRSAGVYEWRVCEADGNFKTVGNNVGDDSATNEVYNKQLLDGTSADIFQFARIYNEIVANLPAGAVCDYDTWSATPQKYSKANSANPAYANKFHFPDRRGIFERNNNAGNVGDYVADSVVPHTHPLAGTQGVVGVTYFGAPNNNISGGGTNGGSYRLTATDANGGGATETQPKNYLINKYVLI